MEKVRKSNFELLRILAMLMIVAHHFAVHTNFQFPSGFTTINRVWIQLIAMGGKIGVNIFVMISGYFLVNSTKMKWNKVFKIWSQLVFYAVAIYLIFVFIGKERFSLKGLIINFQPVGATKWWFATTYLVLYFLASYISCMLNVVKKEQLQRILVIMTMIWCLLPSFTGYSYECSNLLWFAYLYCLGGYIKLYGVNNKKYDSKYYLILGGVAMLLTCCMAICVDYVKYKSDSLVLFSETFYSMQSLAILLVSVLLFFGFEKIELRYNKVINTISSTTFGIYLIHDEGTYVRKFLWNNLIPSVSYTRKEWFIIYSLIVICGVFSICCTIEFLRIQLFEKHLTRWFETARCKLAEKIGKNNSKL